MHLYINKETATLEALPQKSVDSTFFKKFPGFVLTKGVYSAPAKPAVVFNLLTRIKRYQKIRSTLQVTMTKDVADLNTGKVSLLEIPKSFKYFTSPLRHQEVALRFLYTNKGGGLLLDPGLGKTKIVLDYIALSGFKKSVIICPKALLFVWEEEQQKHRPDKSIYVVKSLTWDNYIKTRTTTLEDPGLNETLHRRLMEGIDALRLELKDTKDEADQDAIEKKITSKFKKLNDPKLLSKTLRKLESEISLLIKKRDADWAAMNKADIVVTNYDRAVAGLDKLIDMAPEFMAVDEALVKDHKSGRTQALMKLAHSGPQVCLMSGTLVNNSPEDVFAPVQMMEPSLIGKSMTKFREQYCVLKGKMGRRFTVGYQNTDELKGILRTCSIVMRKDEWLDLPAKKFFPVTIPMPQDVRDLYNEMASNYIATVKGVTIEADSPLTVHCKLSQFGNGFAYRYEEEEDMELLFNQEAPKKKRNVKDRETIFFDQQPKAEALMTLISNTLPDRKFILWYNMSAELTIIEEHLKRDRITYDVIKGGEKDTGGKVTKFNHTQSLQVLVCQAKSVNYGITVLGRTPEVMDQEGLEILPDIDPRVFTHVFYSLSYSLEMYIQQQDRSHRIGITRSPEYYLLLADLPIEQMVGERLTEKEELRDDFLEDSLNARA